MAVRTFLCCILRQNSNDLKFVWWSVSQNKPIHTHTLNSAIKVKYFQQGSEFGCCRGFSASYTHHLRIQNWVQEDKRCYWTYNISRAILTHSHQTFDIILTQARPYWRCHLLSQPTPNIISRQNNNDRDLMHLRFSHGSKIKTIFEAISIKILFLCFVELFLYVKRRWSWKVMTPFFRRSFTFL